MSVFRLCHRHRRMKRRRKQKPPVPLGKRRATEHVGQNRFPPASGRDRPQTSASEGNSARTIPAFSGCPTALSVFTPQFRSHHNAGASPATAVCTCVAHRRQRGAGRAAALRVRAQGPSPPVFSRVLRAADQIEGWPRLGVQLELRSNGLFASLSVRLGTVCKTQAARRWQAENLVK